MKLKLLVDGQSRLCAPQQTDKGPVGPVTRWTLTAEEKPVASGGWLSNVQGLISARVDVKRGWGHVSWADGEAEEESLDGAVGRVFVLVHGIGEKLWSEEGVGLGSGSGAFRRNVHAHQLATAGCKQRGPDQLWEAPRTGRPPMPKDEVLEASWWQTIHTDELDHRLDRITLPSMPQVRSIANCALADALFYMQGGKREAILKSVVASVNASLARFRRHHPQFDGDVVLVGHSLGGAILFELLRRGLELLPKEHQLSFVPRVLFTMGSPVGIFLHTADDVPDAGYSFPGGTRYLNVFHPLDPVAYRVEPLFAAELAGMRPAQVPSESALGGVKVHHGVNHLVRWATGEDKQAEEALRDTRLMLNHGDRIDWVLQDDMNMMGGVGEVMAALPSHSCYFRSVDVAAFVHRQSVAAANATMQAGPRR